MKQWVVGALLTAACLAVYWPHADAQFVLDDYYTVVRNPLIKNPSLYQNIWTSRLFDADLSSGNVKFGYYRPLLQSSWILDYRLFGLKASGYQWVNLLIHGLNCFLIYFLLLQLFGQEALALGASLLFCVLPSQEWVVRYVTGRGDELSALFGLASLVSLLWGFKTGFKRGYLYAFGWWGLAALTREVAISYVLFAFLLLWSYSKDRNINRFSLFWFIIGILPLLVIWPILPRLGNILGLHVLYLASLGLCLWLAQARPVLVGFLAIFFAAISFYQGRFWTTEETLLRHTHTLEWRPDTPASEQLLMRYDSNVPAIENLVIHSRDPLTQTIWLRRLGVIYFERGDAAHAQYYFSQALAVNPHDVDTLYAYGVACMVHGQEAQGLDLLKRAIIIKPVYPDTLRTLGIYYCRHNHFAQGRFFLSQSLLYDPDNAQTKELLRLANRMN